MIPDRPGNWHLLALKYGYASVPRRSFGGLLSIYSSSFSRSREACSSVILSNPAKNVALMCGLLSVEPRLIKYLHLSRRISSIAADEYPGVTSRQTRPPFIVLGQLRS